MKYGLYLIKLLLLGTLIILHFKVLHQWFVITPLKLPTPTQLTVHLVTLKQEAPKIVKNEMILMEQKQATSQIIPTISAKKAVKVSQVPKVKKLSTASPTVKIPNPPAPKISKIQEKLPILPKLPKRVTIPPPSPAMARVTPEPGENYRAPMPLPLSSKNVTVQENFAQKSISSKTTVSSESAPIEKTVIGNHVENRPTVINTTVSSKSGASQENLAGKSTKSIAQKSTEGQKSQVYTPPNYRAAYLHNPKPPYPIFSRQLEEEGTVHLLVHLDARGQVRQVQLKSSCGYARLDAAALQAVQQWKFIPAKQGDTPIAATTVVPITFRLSDD